MLLGRLDPGPLDLAVSLWAVLLVPVLVLDLVPVLVLGLVVSLVPLVLFPAFAVAPPGPPLRLRGQFAFLRRAHELGLISLSHKSIFSCWEEPVAL